MEMLTTLNSSYDNKNWRNVYVDVVSLSKVTKFLPSLAWKLLYITEIILLGI